MTAKKVTRRKKKEITEEKSQEVAKKEPSNNPPTFEVATSHSLTQLYYEMDTVKLQMDMFTDAELFDYCIDHIQMYKNKELDRLYPKLAQGKELTPEERRKLEAFCILANTELFIHVDEKKRQ
jgi:hypothetical protein